jgi:arsenate reductase (thioredoxin)
MTETRDLNLSLDQNVALRSAAEWVEGKALTGRPTVLFLCTHNAGRSQMALGFFQRLAGDRAVAWSGGSEPGDELNPAAVEAMHERGIDITGEFPKPWTDDGLRRRLPCLSW